MIKRTNGFQIIYTEQQKKWRDSSCCPICGLPKSEWKRRKDWTCCSWECTDKHKKININYWPIVRSQIISRDKNTCLHCGYFQKSESAFVVDHIIPIAIGGSEWDKSNMQTLCTKCNKLKTKKDAGHIANKRKLEKNASGNGLLYYIPPEKQEVIKSGIEDFNYLKNTDV